MSRFAGWLRPSLLGLHAFALVAVGFCVVMGLWQLGIYDTRQGDAATERQSNAPVELSSVWGPDEAFGGELDALPVTVDGSFAPAEQQVWIAPREQGDVEGAWLVAPFLVDGSESALLIVRGWAPGVGALPEVPSGGLSVTGLLQQGESGVGSFDSVSRTLGSIRLPTLVNELPFDLYSGYAIGTDEAVAGGLELADLPTGEVSWTTGLRNLAYALQWWVFGAFALFMWWRMTSESVAAARSQVA